MDNIYNNKYIKQKLFFDFSYYENSKQMISLSMSNTCNYPLNLSESQCFPMD